MNLSRILLLKLISVRKIFLVCLRSCIYSNLLAGGRKVKVYGRIAIEHPKRCSFGNGITLNEGVYINARGGLQVGSQVRLSAGCKIITTGLNIQGEHENGAVKIGDRVWIGAGAIILPGVSIANDCVIGAGAVVNKSCLIPGSLIVGVPAIIKRRR